MLAKRLRLLLLLELLLTAGIALSLQTYLEWDAASAWGLAMAAFLGVNSVVPLATGLLALFWSRRSDPPLRPTLWQALRAVLLDWPVFLALYLIIQPFPGVWMRRETREAATSPGPLVLLVHGYCCNRALWCWFARKLRQHGIRVATVDLEPPLAEIDQLAAVLSNRVAELTGRGGEARIILICSSMGGLVARAFLSRDEGRQIAGLITIGTPHRGTAIARLGLGANARNMRPGSAFLERLASAGLPHIPILTIWSTADTFVMPQDRARLAGGA
jgi:triacylglycerol lipase